MTANRVKRRLRRIATWWFKLSNPHLALATLILIAVPATAAAWGPSAHRIVAELAERQLDTAVREEIGRLLKRSGSSSLVGIANWADEIRDEGADSELAQRTRRMHFVNFTSAECRYDPGRLCVGGACAVAAIETTRSPWRPRSQRRRTRQALRFLVHFVADIHQPCTQVSPGPRRKLHQVQMEARAATCTRSGIRTSWAAGGWGGRTMPAVSAAKQ